MTSFISSFFAFASAEKSQTKSAAIDESTADAPPSESLPDGNASSPLIPTSLPIPSNKQSQGAITEPYRPLESTHEGGVHFDTTLPPLPAPQSFGSLDAVAIAALNPIAENHQSLSALRMRSLSRLFTRLPDKPLPSYPQMVTDQLEFMMHVILLETNPVRASQHLLNLKAIYKTFGALPHCKRLMRSGRLYSRSMLCGLAADIVVLAVDGGEEHDVVIESGPIVANAHESVIPAAVDLLSENWASIQQQLEHLRRVLLRTNADAPVNFEMTEEGTNGDAVSVDEQLAKHSMMTVDFEEVRRLLAVQVELARLKETLLDMMEESNTTNVKSSKETPSLKGGKTPTLKSINKFVQKAVNDFMKSLTSIYPPVNARVVEFDDDDDDDFDSDEEEDNDRDSNLDRDIAGGSNSKRRYSMSNIPKELHSLAVTELYSPKQHPQRATDLVERILSDILSITSDAPTPAMTYPGTFSHVNLQNKMRTLLIKWSESILQVPTLVQLGYGGVPSPLVDRDDDDVSSWGGDSVLDEETEKRTHIMRSQSYTRITNAAMVGRSSPLTGEQKDAIALIATNGAQGTQHHSLRGGKHRRKGKGHGKKGKSTARSIGEPPKHERTIALNTGQGKRNRMQVKDSIDRESAGPPNSVSRADIDTDGTMLNKGRLLPSNLDLLSSLACFEKKEKTKWGHDEDVHFGDQNGREGAVSDDSSVDIGRRPVKLSRVKIGLSRPNKRLRTLATHQRKVTAMEENEPPTSATKISRNEEGSKLPAKSQTQTGAALEWNESEDDFFNPLYLEPSLNSSTNGTAKQRRAWTKEETDALRNGVDRHGVGHWKEIQESDRRLKHRTPRQLKDRHRTMVNRGEM